MNTFLAGRSSRALLNGGCAGVLIALLLFSALAAAAPCLHDWVHPDHQEPAHSCLVTLLDHGCSESAPAEAVTVARADLVSLASFPAASFFMSHHRLVHPGRGPPLPS